MGVRRTWWGRRRAMGSAVAAVAVLALAGCASLPGSGATPGAGGDAGGDAAGGSGGGGETDGRPLLQVVHEGAFVPMGWDFSRAPELTVYPDGLVVTHGPQILMYPGPALPALVTYRMDDADVEALVAAARDAGLLTDGTEYGTPPVADAGRAVVTIRVEGQEYVHTAEALGTGDGTEMLDPETGEGEMTTVEGVTAEQRDARAALARFLAKARSLGEPGADELFEFDGFAVFATPAAVEESADGLERTVATWPVDGIDLAAATECVAVTGEDGAALHEALAAADQSTVWEQDGARYDLFVRPFLPHESTCDDVL